MSAYDSRIKLAEQVVAAHKAKLATTANKDEVRRSIKAAEDRLRLLMAEARKGPCCPNG